MERAGYPPAHGKEGSVALRPGRHPGPSRVPWHPLSRSSLPAPAAPRAGETTRQARQCFLKTCKQISLTRKGKVKHKPWLSDFPASHPKQTWKTSTCCAYPFKPVLFINVCCQISLWSLLVTLVILFILTGTMLGPDLMAHIPASVYAIAVLMPLAGYALGYGLATVFKMPPHCRRTVSLETGCQNVQLCTAILKLTFPPELIGSMYMFPLLYALFQSAEAGLFVLVYKMYGRDSYKQDTLGEEEDTDISYRKLKEEEVGDTSYGTVTTDEHNSVQVEVTQTTAL
uniref:Solute carrier family 10 member 4 n=1 Tax=Otus sunia TaxID=257818 RepID=A0A8C8AUT8_9STRI